MRRCAALSAGRGGKPWLNTRPSGHGFSSAPYVIWAGASGLMCAVEAARNGLDVIVHQDRNCPIVAVNVWYHAGSAREKPGRTGFAHLFEHIMFMGSENVPVGAFDGRLHGWLQATGGGKPWRGPCGVRGDCLPRHRAALRRADGADRGPPLAGRAGASTL